MSTSRSSAQRAQAPKAAAEDYVRSIRKEHADTLRTAKSRNKYMLTYDLTQREGIPLYEYLYHQIREDILDGKLPSGTRLPSKRSFAVQLGISSITVENAYAQLQAEGYICSKPRKGFFVSEAEDLELLRPYTQQYSEKIMPDKTSAAQQEERSVYFADLAGNQMDPALFPFSNWARLMRRILSERQEDLLQNAPSEGVWLLRQAIASQLRAFRGMQVSAEQIIIGAGTEFLYGLLIQLLGFHQIYANEDPGYARPSAVFEAYGVRHVRIPLDERGISLEALEKSGATVAHVTPSHHFPTGMMTGPERRAGLLSWACASPERFLIEDDYDSEMPVSGHALRPLYAADTNECVIYMNTFTKSLASTIRISYMVLPERLLRVYRTKLGFYSSPVPVVDQYVLAEFLQEGFFENHINRMRNYARRKYAALLASFKEETAEQYFTISGENAGMEFILTLRVPVDEEIWNRELKKKGIRIRTLASYYADPNSERARRQTGKYVLNYSSMPLADVPETVNRMCEAARMASQHVGTRSELRTS